MRHRNRITVVTDGAYRGPSENSSSGTVSNCRCVCTFGEGKHFRTSEAKCDPNDNADDDRHEERVADSQVSDCRTAEIACEQNRSEEARPWNEEQDREENLEDADLRDQFAGEAQVLKHLGLSFPLDKLAHGARAHQ